MTPRRRTTALPAVLLVTLAGLAGCSGDEPTTAPPQAAPESPSASPTPTRSASPSPSPSPSPPPPPPPLSPFEDDPAVQGLRTYLAAVSAALNAKDLQLPALAEASTASRHSVHPEIYTEDLGPFYPGPIPLEIKALRTVSATEKVALGCVVDGGFGLTAPGGSPATPFEIVTTEMTIRMEDGRWKLHSAFLADGMVDCTGLTLEDVTT